MYFPYLCALESTQLKNLLSRAFLGFFFPAKTHFQFLFAPPEAANWFGMVRAGTLFVY